MIAWLKREWCLVFGHRRGKSVGIPVMAGNGKRYQTYSCPRCEGTWIRKAKEAKA